MTGVPSGSAEVRTVKRSTDIVVAYDTIGLSSFQRNVVRPPCSVVGPGRPLPTTVQPVGTVAVRCRAALSDGWSATGNQAVAECGSPVTLTPPLVSWCQLFPTGAPL